MGFDFDREQRERLSRQLMDGINDYYSSLTDRPVQLPLAERNFSDLQESLPELGEDASIVLQEAIENLIHNGFHVPSANYFGLMNPTPTYMAVLAEALVATLNPQLASLARSQYASRIERETIRWIADRVGWEGTEKFEGTFTSGGNEANFSALSLALHSRFPEVKQHGLASLGARPALYCSSEAHHSLEKAAILMGLGQDSIRRIPVTETLQMDMAALSVEIDHDLSLGMTPLAVIATAGTTSSGAIDPLPALAAFCRERGLWLHVDGAYGAALVLSDEHRHLLHGISKADSVTMDPHKWLAMPFAAGLILTRHPHLLEQTFGVETAYMPRIEHQSASGEPLPPDFYRISAQWSRRMNSLKLWLTLKVHGRQGYQELMSRQMLLARKLENALLASGDFTLACHSDLPIVNLRLNAPSESRSDLHRAFVAEVTAEGQFWISTTRVRGESVIRLMVISYLTEERHVAQLASAMSAAARKVLQTASVRA
jgi:glutamate/tyrosine decarboxylase-like PLP-dependent enzyme